MGKKRFDKILENWTDRQTRTGVSDHRFFRFDKIGSKSLGQSNPYGSDCLTKLRDRQTLLYRFLTKPPCAGGYVKRLGAALDYIPLTGFARKEIDDKIERSFVKVHFFMNMKPPTKTQQEHKFAKRKDGSVYMYEDRDLKEARHELYKNLVHHAPEAPYSSAVRLVVKWCFPCKGKHSNGEYKTSKPDTDNLNKMLKDEMTKAGFWDDDALVVSEIIEKFWADIPGIFVEIEEVD